MTNGMNHEGPISLAGWLRRLCLALISTLLVACGGGGGGTDGSGVPPFGGPGGGGTDPGGGTGASPTVSVSISSSAITPQTPATITVVLRDAAGAAVAGSVVNLSTVRTDIGVLSAPSVLTDASGTATVGLSVATSGVAGADSVIAIAVLGTTTVQGRVGFTTTGASATVIATISSTLLKVSTGPATLKASVHDEHGVAVAGQVVSFSSTGGQVVFGAASARSDSLGIATTTVLPKDASVNAAETLIASTTVNGKDLQSSLSVQLAADIPSLVVTLSNSNVTTSQPATVHATLRDSNGSVVPGSIVSFSSQFGLGTFDALTAATDVTGQATVTVSPKSATTAGADYVVAKATLNGVTQTTQTVVQFSPSVAGGTPVLQLGLSSSSITSGSPATATATLKDSRGLPVPGQVVTFAVVRGLARTNISTALTSASGQAVVTLTPSSSSVAGADEITASASYSGAALQATVGFQVQAVNVTITDFTSLVPSLSAYGQTSLTVTTSGASVGSPINISVSSSCVSQGKASLSPSTFTTTTATTVLQYKDNGCGALQITDELQAVVVGTASSKSLTLAIQPPTVSSLAFVSAAPEVIYLKGSGFAEASFVTFEVRDSAGNPLPNQVVEISLMTQAGGVTLNGGSADVVQTSDAAGRVTVRINSGTVPTPVRVSARLQGNPKVTTVSSNLGIAVGLPSQLNFSLSQRTKNIDCYNIDGVPNVYMVLGGDRNGNPLPSGTSINFVTEGGQIEAIMQTQIVGGISTATVNFACSEPRPVDGRITITAFALGEESFIDNNGNNVYDVGEPFQDLGNIFKDRNFDGFYDKLVDEYVSLEINNTSACVTPGNQLLSLDPSIPTVPASCDGEWSGISNFARPPNLVYVRRATETVLSTSTARPQWANTSGLSAECRKVNLQVGPNPTDVAQFTQVVSGETWYGGQDGSLVFYISDANPGSVAKGLLPRFNPMAAGTAITATTASKGLSLIIGGSPVPSTTEATAGGVAYSFDPAVNTTGGSVNIDFKSPSGLITTITINLKIGAAPSSCAP